QRHMVEGRIKPSCIPGNTRGQHRNIKADLAKQRAKSAIKLVTYSAATLFDDFSNHFFFVEDNPSAYVIVEVLKRYSEQVGFVQVAERLCGHLQSAAVSHPIKVARNIHVSNYNWQKGSCKPA